MEFLFSVCFSFIVWSRVPLCIWAFVNLEIWHRLCFKTQRCQYIFVLLGQLFPQFAASTFIKSLPQHFCSLVTTVSVGNVAGMPDWFYIACLIAFFFFFKTRSKILLIEALVFCCSYSAWFSVFLTSKKKFVFGWVFFFFCPCCFCKTLTSLKSCM